MNLTAFIMKNLFLLFILVSLTLSAGAQSVEEKNAKLFANTLFYTVKKNDLEAFKKHAITLTDYEKIVAQNPKLSKDEKQQIMTKGKEDIVQYHERKAFDRIQKAVKREFIDWSQIKIENLEHKIEKRGALQVLSFTIYFKFEQRTFAFTATDCIKTPSGWKMSKGADLKYTGK
jgi:hypothetical protein